MSCSICSLASHILSFSESRPPPRYVVSTRAVLYSGSSPQPSGSGCRGGVVFPPKGGDRSAVRLGLSVAGLICNTSTMVLPLCCSLVSDPQAVFEDVFSPSLGLPGRVYFSTLPLVGWVVA